MTNTHLSVWLVTREYAGIAEAGGVKNVACSLAEGLARNGVSVTVFIPRYGCVRQSGNHEFTTTVTVLGVEHRVAFLSATLHGISIVFIDSPIFFEKDEVYVYTDREARMIHGAVRGQGHSDMDCMNLVHQRSVLEYARIMSAAPDVVHCQDAHTALLPALARTDPAYRALFARSAFAVTIHNAGPGYRQIIPGLDRAATLTGLNPDVLVSGMSNGNLEPFLLAADHAHLTTVSPWYAGELTSHQYSAMTEGLSGEFEKRGVHITGIVNGIDYHRYDPSNTDYSCLPFTFNPLVGDLEGKYRARAFFTEQLDQLAEQSGLACHGSLHTTENNVYFTYQGRIVWQKGLDIFVAAAREVLERMPRARFIVLGQGDPALEEALKQTALNYPGSFLFLHGYERALARLSVAVADFLVLPSRFEPCGLEDYIGQIFATLPVANAVGGLQKIRNEENGFLYYTGFSGNPATILADRLVDLAEPVIASGGIGAASVPEYYRMVIYAASHVQADNNWDAIIRDHYLPFYHDIISAMC